MDVRPDCDGGTLRCRPGANTGTLKTLRVVSAGEPIEKGAGRAPDLVKRYVQGFELNVLKGGQELVETAEVFIIEVNPFRCYPEMPLVREVVAPMAERALRRFDVGGMLRCRYQSDPGRKHPVFVSSRSPMRSSNRWA